MQAGSRRELGISFSGHPSVENLLCGLQGTCCVNLSLRRLLSFPTASRRGQFLSDFLSFVLSSLTTDSAAERLSVFDNYPKAFVFHGLRAVHYTAFLFTCKFGPKHSSRKRLVSGPRRLQPQFLGHLDRLGDNLLSCRCMQGAS